MVKPIPMGEGRPKNTMEPPLAPLHFGEEKMRKKERKKRGKKKSAPPLRIYGFTTMFDIYLLETLA